ncbi:MAG: DnaA ATPase domain-containing protein [Planctomycetota bacterium]
MKKLLGFTVPKIAVETPLFQDDGNRVCAGAIAKIAGGRFDFAMPLVIVGAGDTGKTRHLEELINLTRPNGRAVAAGTVRDWTRRFREAIRSRGVESLADEILSADFFIIDEFHRFKTSPKTLEFIVQRVIDRTEKRRPTILASRYNPKEIYQLTRRAYSVLSSGFVVFLAAPCAEVRREYLLSISKNRLTKSEVERICSVSAGGLGALKETYQKWIHATKSPSANPYLLTIERILSVVSQEFGISEELIMGRRRTSGVHFARRVFIKAAAERGFSTRAIATILDRRGAQTIEGITTEYGDVALDPDRGSVVKILRSLDGETTKGNAS